MDTAVQNIAESWPVLIPWMAFCGLIGLVASTADTSDWSFETDRADLNWLWIGAIVGAFAGAAVLGIDMF